MKRTRIFPDFEAEMRENRNWSRTRQPRFLGMEWVAFEPEFDDLLVLGDPLAHETLELFEVPEGPIL